MSAIRNPNLGPSQLRTKRRRLFFVRLVIIIFFLLVVIFGLAIFSGNEKVKIQTIIVSGNTTISSDAILAIANRDMTGRYGYLFAKNNFIIFPRFQIKESILKEFKTVKDVNISWTGWQKISIIISERRPHSVWCRNDINVVERECLFVDKEGYIYSQAPTFSGSMFIKNYGNISTSTDPLGQYFLPTKTYIQIFTLIDNLDQNNLKVIAVSFDGFDYKFVLEMGPTIIFNDKNSFDSSFANLFSAIETKNLDLIKEADNINYIDLRFDNKIVIGKKIK
ncbi:MAG: hypothetical protein A2541_00625 [Candidatus Taylorbacteria bacterium RIFOXYD2_FULL_36_9]|uniref:POTRA domain-containing protein n=1 Tax=Candidatus Taylorbacteria bacterium RIFOXYD2_FULL_36_9 TaxID=1802338 RepID=A0A1G2PCV7_9BACT|nr:MAG: hypothetical protein A2541_00625 [Candidatus Taylorbacteria bacterium RIFOXYD2_FULL_36_9]